MLGLSALSPNMPKTKPKFPKRIMVILLIFKGIIEYFISGYWLQSEEFEGFLLDWG